MQRSAEVVKSAQTVRFGSHDRTAPHRTARPEVAIVSSLMVDRVVGDQYEWRDRSYRETNGRCGQIFDDGG